MWLEKNSKWTHSLTHNIIRKSQDKTIQHKTTTKQNLPKHPHQCVSDSSKSHLRIFLHTPTPHHARSPLGLLLEWLRLVWFCEKWCRHNIRHGPMLLYYSTFWECACDIVPQQNCPILYRIHQVKKRSRSRTHVWGTEFRAVLNTCINLYGTCRRGQL